MCSWYHYIRWTSKYKRWLEEEKEEKENVLISLDEIKLKFQKLSDENKIFAEESNFLKSKNLKLKYELESSQKNFIETQNKLNNFIERKEVLDILTQLASNKNKRGLGFEG